MCPSPRPARRRFRSPPRWSRRYHCYCCCCYRHRCRDRRHRLTLQTPRRHFAPSPPLASLHPLRRRSRHSPVCALRFPAVQVCIPHNPLRTRRRSCRSARLCRALGTAANSTKRFRTCCSAWASLRHSLRSRQFRVPHSLPRRPRAPLQSRALRAEGIARAIPTDQICSRGRAWHRTTTGRDLPLRSHYCSLLQCRSHAVDSLLVLPRTARIPSGRAPKSVYRQPPGIGTAARRHTALGTRKLSTAPAHAHTLNW